MHISRVKSNLLALFCFALAWVVRRATERDCWRWAWESRKIQQLMEGTAKGQSGNGKVMRE
jgi:hypothetical protein